MNHGLSTRILGLTELDHLDKYYTIIVDEHFVVTMNHYYYSRIILGFSLQGFHLLLFMHENFEKPALNLKF